VARDDGWTRAFLELWLGLASVADVSVRVVARTEGLHSIEQSQVVAIENNSLLDIRFVTIDKFYRF